MSVSLLANSMAQSLPTSVYGRLIVTNTLGAGPNGGLNTIINPGTIELHRENSPSILFDQQGGVSVDIPSQGILRYGQIGFQEFGWSMSRSLLVSGNLRINGALYTSTSISWITNNAVYPTSSQTAAVDLNLAYGDLQINSPVYLTVKNKSPTTYQTAVVLIHNTTGKSTAIVATGMHPIGVLYVTNETVCTIFYNPSAPPIGPFTNIISLPLW